MEKKSDCLEYVAKVYSKSTGHLCIEYGEHILTEIFLNPDETHVEYLVSIISSGKTVVNFDALVRSCALALTSLLVMTLGSSSKRRKVSLLPSLAK